MKLSLRGAAGRTVVWANGVSSGAADPLLRPLGTGNRPKAADLTGRQVSLSTPETSRTGLMPHRQALPYPITDAGRDLPARLKFADSVPSS